jgi:polynucleotide 5'-hydroxyl-kinase GRC3/NOL9
VTDDRTEQKLEDRVPAAWVANLEELAGARIVLVIGATEAGKTTLTAWLANALRARGHRVAIVDADVGQSEIGPPATVGLGEVRGPLTRSGDAEVIDIEFVGVTSPGRRPWQVADATGRLAAKARSRFDRVVVDTSGFVAGGFAAAVKQRKIAAVDPDLVVLVQTSDESEHLVRGVGDRERPRMLRLPAVRGTQSRSPDVRRRHRVAALARYFADARSMTLDTSRIALRTVTGAPVAPETLAEGTLVALQGTNGDTLALAVIDATDLGRNRLTLRTTYAGASVAAVVIGETTLAG